MIKKHHHRCERKPLLIVFTHATSALRCLGWIAGLTALLTYLLAAPNGTAADMVNAPREDALVALKEAQGSIDDLRAEEERRPLSRAELRRLSHLYSVRGTSLGILGKDKEATQSLEVALSIASRLTLAIPSDPDLQIDLADRQGELVFHLGIGDPKGARGSRTHVPHSKSSDSSTDRRPRMRPCRR